MTAEEFKRVRVKLGLTQADAAAVLGLSSSTVVSNIETGFRNPNRLAKALVSLLDGMPVSEAKEFANRLAQQNMRFQ